LLPLRSRVVRNRKEQAEMHRRWIQVLALCTIVLRVVHVAPPAV
jgi:hypothetical protein